MTKKISRLDALKNRLPELIETAENLMLRRSLAGNRERDRDGAITCILEGDLRRSGIALYGQNADVSAFRSNLSEAARLKLSLFERGAAGEPISVSYITMLGAQEAIFNALASCDFDTAQAIAIACGGQDELEKVYDHKFNRTLGYALKYTVLNNLDLAKPAIAEFAKVCASERALHAFANYPVFMQALLDGDRSTINTAVKDIITGHIHLSKGNAVFAGRMDCLVAVWPLGLANLALARGYAVDAIPPLLPFNLLYVSE